VTVQELATAIGAVAVAMAPWLHRRLRELEQVRQPNGKRVGELEKAVDQLTGELRQLSLLAHGRPLPPPPPDPAAERETTSIRVVTCQGCGATVPVRRPTLPAVPGRPGTTGGATTGRPGR
jgi:hypothetical protein